MGEEVPENMPSITELAELQWAIDRGRKLLENKVSEEPDLGEFVIMDQDWQPLRVLTFGRSHGILTIQVDTTVVPYVVEDQ